ncbi:MAG: hypothetical protein ABJA80_16425 [bacterium]
MRPSVLGLAVLLLAAAPPLAAQTADDIISRYVDRAGGMARIQDAQSLRRAGTFIGGGGFEAKILQENRRPNLVREEFTMQGMTAINAYDGRTGWKIDPFGGKKDAEPLSEDEMHVILLDADFDEPLVNYRAKGNKVELIGTDQVEGTDVYKIRVTLPNGDIRHYYMDTDSYMPIRMEEKRIIRGAEQEFETTLGDYKQVNGWFLPFSVESGPKGQDKSTVHYEKIESNVTLADARFAKPVVVVKP